MLATWATSSTFAYPGTLSEPSTASVAGLAILQENEGALIVRAEGSEKQVASLGNDESNNGIMAPDRIRIIPVLIGAYTGSFWLYALARVVGWSFRSILKLITLPFKGANAAIKGVIHAVERVTKAILRFRLPVGGVTGDGKEHLGPDGASPPESDGKVESDRLSLGHPFDAISWDLADNEAHARSNVYNDQHVMDDDMRSEMLDNGLRNITFIHTASDSGSVPILAYQTEDGTTNFHWRPARGLHRPGQHRGKGRGRPLNNNNGKQPFFSSGGAGFKISSTPPSELKSPKYSAHLAQKIAEALVGDLFKNRQDSTFVGYQEQASKEQDSPPRQRLCFIAEQHKFGWENELDKCFSGT